MVFDDEYRKRDRELFEAIGERIPSRMIPKSMAREEVFAIVDECLQRGENLFPQRLGYAELPDSVIY